ncbi:MAG: hypothetical protein IJZ96_07255 [Lachnospiraceae bacterium]|nr:hypothetical protein [Lachnospiraceae bacterium]
MRGKLYDAYMAYSDKLKYKLGDAISYVMLEEFKDVTMTPILNYFSVVSFLYLYEFITENTLKFLKQLIVSAQDEAFEQKELCRLFVRNLMRDPKFKKLISVDDSFEEILEDLNRFEMDSWIVTNGFELYVLIPRTFMTANELFFFRDNNGKSTFMVINIDHIHASTNLEYEAEYISERY